MHELEAPDFVTDTGKNYFKDTDPATVLNAGAANAMFHELRNAVVASGQTLAASAAADRTAGYVQLIEAIKRIPWIKASVSFTVSSDPIALSPAVGDSPKIISLAQGGSDYPGGIIVLSDDAAHLGKILFIINNSSSAKVIAKDTTATWTVHLPIGRMAIMYGYDSGSSVIHWECLNQVMRRDIAVDIYAEGVGPVVAQGSGVIVQSDGIVSVYLNPIYDTIAAEADYMDIIFDSFPEQIGLPTNAWLAALPSLEFIETPISILVSDSSGNVKVEVASGRLMSSGTAGKARVRVYRLGLDDAIGPPFRAFGAAGAMGITGQVLTFKAQ
jgi:hypothetical protein